MTAPEKVWPDDPWSVAQRVAKWYMMSSNAPPAVAERVLSDACLGAVKGERDYDPSRGTPKHWYLRLRARAEVIDGARRNAPVRRRSWQRYLAGQDLPENERPAVTLDGYQDIDVMDSAGIAALEHVEDASWCRSLLQTLPNRERYIMEQVFLHDRKKQDVAAELGVHPSRISQLISQAAYRMRAAHKESA